jgi:hypothetical protein
MGRLSQPVLAGDALADAIAQRVMDRLNVPGGGAKR